MRAIGLIVCGILIAQTATRFIDQIKKPSGERNWIGPTIAGGAAIAATSLVIGVTRGLK